MLILPQDSCVQQHFFIKLRMRKQQAASDDEKMWLFVLFVSVGLTSAEVFTLTKDNNVTCVLTEDSAYSALHLSSTSEKYEDISVKRPRSILNKWIIDDWQIGTTKEHSFYPVTDFRWEGFPIATDIEEIEVNPKASISFSMCFNKLLISSVHMVSIYSQNKNERSCQWNHFVVTKNKLFQLTSQEMTEIDQIHSVSRFLFMRGSKVYKEHNYDFRYSHNASLNKFSSVELNNISTSSNLCISFFVSIDEDCYLDVTLKSSSVVKTFIKGFNIENVRTWKRVTIKTDSYNGTGTLEFNRLGKNFGFWAIDAIQICKPEIDTFTTEITSADSYQCKTMKTESFTDDFLCNSPGLLGQNCLVNCKSIFGNTYPFCEGHRICSGHNCTCAWGYESDFCDKPCNKGYWGLKCSSEYNITNCKKYDNVVGCMECNDDFYGSNCSPKLPVVLKPPTLIKIADNYVEIALDGLEFDHSEAIPTHHFIQTKKNIDREYNDGFVEPYLSSTINKNVFINLSPKDHGYQIRVILVTNGLFSEKNVPELVIFKRSLKVIFTNTTNIELSWEKPGSVENYFLLKYQCYQKFNSHHFVKNQKATSNYVNIEYLEPSLNCTIKLLTENEELIDEVVASTLDNLLLSDENINQREEMNVNKRTAIDTNKSYVQSGDTNSDKLQTYKLIVILSITNLFIYI